VKTIKLKHQSHLSHPKIHAASSLLNTESRIFLCSDDQYTLFELHENKWKSHSWDNAPTLPINSIELKKVKPDFECLLKISKNEIGLIPSGSKDNRSLALILNFLSQEFRTLNLKSFFSELSMKIQKINIEGALSLESEYLFLNRGIGEFKSSIIRVDRDSFKIKNIHEIDFGLTDNLHLHGSELSIHNNKLFALAVAENASNSYEDGKIHGSGFFKLSMDNFEVEEIFIFDHIIKAEGLCRYQDEWLIATDPDGEGISQFYSF